jgi:hypothetical protein
MQLTEIMRQQLLADVVAAQQEDNPLLIGIDLHRLKVTLEREISADELASIMMTVGRDRGASMQALCLAMIDRITPDTESSSVRVEPSPPSRAWKVEQPAHSRLFRHLTHRGTRAHGVAVGRLA